MNIIFAQNVTYLEENESVEYCITSASFPYPVGYMGMQPSSE